MRIGLLVLACLSSVGCFGTTCRRQALEVRMVDGTIAEWQVSICHPRLRVK